MHDVIGYKEVEEKVLTIRGQSVLLDRDVAMLYGVEAREINQAVKNNPHKFPDGYIIVLDAEERSCLRSKLLILNSGGRGQHTKYLPKAFTEKGLYMLATILKSPKATRTTIAIVETFAQIRELAKSVAQLAEVKEENQQKALMQKSGEILADILDNDMEVTGDETTVELNLAFVKFKRTVKRGKKPPQPPARP